jgi:hypothetical protein
MLPAARAGLHWQTAEPSLRQLIAFFVSGGLSGLDDIADIASALHFDEYSEMWAFVRSVLLGSLAASWLPLLFTIGFALSSLPNGITGDGRLLPILWLAVTPLVIAMVVVAPAMILVGLPTTWVLRKRGLESSDTYMTIGAVAGFTIPLIVIAVFNFSWAIAWLSILGAFSGAVTAKTWWKASRQRYGG